MKDEAHPSVGESRTIFHRVLLYWLITGHQYLNFSFERKKLFTQVANDEPLPFKNFDTDFPGELFDVLAKALSKDPGTRFESLNAFANALTNVKNVIFESSKFYVFNKQNTEEQFLSFCLQKFGWESPLIEKGLRDRPTCSINYGSAGIAYMYHRLACVRQDAALCHLADVWANRAAASTVDWARVESQALVATRRVA